MTLQQFEYIIAVSKHKHFGKAAEACGITQSTLSSMIQKLELELDTQIFNRATHPVSLTPLGEEIVKQAEVVMYNSAQVKELALSEKCKEEGEIKLAVIPTIAPYILPNLIKDINKKYPKLKLSIIEERTSNIIEMLNEAKIDVALLATPLDVPNMLEIPIYYEKFVAYVSPNDALHSSKEINSTELPERNLWVLKEGHCLRNQVFNICESESKYSTIYEAGSIDTLIKIVDNNGGYTVIPELHRPFLGKKQQANVRELISPVPNREISLMVRHDFVRERILNILAETIRTIVPPTMIDNRLKKFAIRL